MAERTQTQIAGFFYVHSRIGDFGAINPLILNPNDNRHNVSILFTHVDKAVNANYRLCQEIPATERSVSSFKLFPVDLPVEPIESLQDRVLSWLEENQGTAPLVGYRKACNIWPDGFNEENIHYIATTQSLFRGLSPSCLSPQY